MRTQWVLHEPQWLHCSQNCSKQIPQECREVVPTSSPILQMGKPRHRAAKPLALGPQPVCGRVGLKASPVTRVPAQHVSRPKDQRRERWSCPCSEFASGIFLTFLHAPGQLFVPRERLGSENLGILLSLPSRMRPVLCPHRGFQVP